MNTKIYTWTKFRTICKIWDKENWFNVLRSKSIDGFKKKKKVGWAIQAFIFQRRFDIKAMMYLRKQTCTKRYVYTLFLVTI